MNFSILKFQQLKSLRKLNKLQYVVTKSYSSNTVNESKIYQSQLFSLEQKRQREAVGRVEKIEIRYLGMPDDGTLVMNKNISTPYDCAQHLSEGHCKRSALGLVNGSIPWDMHRPLNESCTLQLLNFTNADPHLANRAFWRTCSLMLGASLQNAFKEKAGLILHSFPGPNIKSGSFIYDIKLSERNWKPTSKELRSLSAEMIKLSGKDLRIECLDVSLELALEIFKDNIYKKEQLPNIDAQNGRITLYRIGDHVEISKGPMVGSTSFLGKCTISAVHEIGQEGDADGIYRVQGVALPVGIILNHFAYGIIEERSRKLNPARLPTEPFDAVNTSETLVA